MSTDAIPALLKVIDLARLCRNEVGGGGGGSTAGFCSKWKSPLLGSVDGSTRDFRSETGGGGRDSRLYQMGARW